MKDKIDLFSSELKHDPYPLYTKLRQMGPLYKTNLPEGGSLWYITTYEQVVQVLQDHQTFINDPTNLGENQFPPQNTGLSGFTGHHLLLKDPPNHTRLRKLIAKSFSNPAITAHSGAIKVKAQDLITTNLPRGKMEVFSDYAFPLSISVLTQLLGIPQDRTDEFQRWAKAANSAPSTVGTASSSEEYAEYYAAFTAFKDYIIEIIELKKAEPADDLISDLVRANLCGEMSEEELFSMLFLLTLAGHDTTVNLIVHALLALLQFPDQMHLLQEKPELIDNCIEETLRFYSPVDRGFIRYVANSTILAGIQLQKGDAIRVLIGSANRDESRFDSAELYDITRNVVGHTSFGKGIHHCVGAPLARLQGRIAIQSLIQSLPKFELAVPYTELEWQIPYILRQIEQLPIKWEVP